MQAIWRLKVTESSGRVRYVGPWQHEDLAVSRHSQYARQVPRRFASVEIEKAEEVIWKPNN